MRCFQTVALLASLLTNGCVIASIPIGYTGAIGAHEAGHVIAAHANGVERVTVDFVPRFKKVTNDTNATFRFAETVATHKPWSKGQEDLFKLAGPATSLLLHMSLREALKGGLVPPVLQTPVAWIALGSEISLLYHSGLGLARVKGSDLGDIDIWYSVGLLGCLIAYDVYDFWDDGDTKFRVALGQKKYKAKFGLVATPQILGFKLEF